MGQVQPARAPHAGADGAATIRRGEQIWQKLDTIIREHGLPERVGDPLFDAALGFRIRRPTYVHRAGIEERTATRDLARLVDEHLLEPVGQTRGQHYVAGAPLRELRIQLQSERSQLADPYPWLPVELRRLTAGAPVSGHARALVEPDAPTIGR